MDYETLPNAEETAILAEEIFKKLPILHKRIVIDEQFLMVLGGIKAGIDLNLLGTAYQKEEFEQMCEVFKKVGLEISQQGVDGDRRDGLPLMKNFVFNPKTLNRETANSKFAPPYRVGQSLKEWLDEAGSRGYKIQGLYGKMYSYPESAIDNYLSRHVDNDLLGLMPDEITVENHDELYVTTFPIGKDAAEREQAKAEFFYKIDNNPSIKRIRKSEDLRLSKQEWTRRQDEMYEASKQRNNSNQGNELRRVFIGE